MTKQAGHRDLSLIRATGSTARVINLNAVHERFGGIEEYAAAPFFVGRRLNRSAIIIKHALREHERHLAPDGRMCVTKLILPYSSKELQLGGVSALIGEKKFTKFLSDVVGGYRSQYDLERDLSILGMLDELPSFDPFLLRERLRLSNIKPARCYFEIIEADVERMRTYVTAELTRLIGLALTNHGPMAGDMAKRLADKLILDDTAAALEPLRETLHLTGPEYAEGIFAWKGFLYYKWMMSDIQKAREAFFSSFNAFRLVDATNDERRVISDNAQKIITNMRVAEASVNATLLEYTDAYRQLTEGRPNAFRDFLLRAPGLFIPIGEAIGVVKHIMAFWAFHSPRGLPPRLRPDEALDMFADFSAALTSALRLIR